MKAVYPSGVFDKVERANKIRLKALDRRQDLRIDAEGCYPFAFNMKWITDGILFVDHLSALKRTGRKN